MLIKDKNIVVGITGGIAAYKSLEVVRLLKKEGANVFPIMTKAATEFVTPLSFATLSENYVATDLFTPRSGQGLSHLKPAEIADVLLVAPATANIIGKLANGIADDLLSTVLMATKAPILLAPAMNTNMYESQAVRENIAKLKKRGVGFVGPASGELACGTEGKGRLAEPEDIIDAVKERLSADDLKGEKVLVTAGSTREAFDPIRFISNASSGLMGYALARAARRRGAEVVLVSGPSNLPRPGQVAFVGVEDANEMREEVLCHFPQSTIVIMAAAVSDFRPALRHSKKMKKGAEKLTIDFEQTSDILKELGEMNKDGRAGDKFLVGFSLETEDLKKNATGKLKNKNLDMVVANGPVGLGSQTNEVMVIDSTGTALELPPMAKEEVAERILDRVVELKG